MQARVRHDVGHRLVAGVPDAGQDRLGRRPAMARATASVSKAARSARAPPPRTTAMTSQSLRLESGDGAGDGGGRIGALHRDRDQRDAEAEPRARELAEEVLTALGAGAGDQADVQRDVGHRERTVAPEQPLGLERLAGAARWAAMRPSSAVTSTSTRMRLISPLAR